MTGILFLALAKIKHMLAGYSTPKPFAVDETDRCIEYSINLANDYLAQFHAAGISIEGKHVLELGPGSDLGLGLYLVKQGAASYVGFDKNNLAGRVPPSLYARMAERGLADVAALQDGRVSYAVSDAFDLTSLSSIFDIVVSNAAFEHFDDVEQTVRQLRKVVRAGGIASIGVDLQTHSRWIREKDPNNIYRYSESIYRFFYFPGQPNRLRPSQYRRFFEQSGWSDLALVPQKRLNSALPARFDKRFAGEQHSDWLSFTLFAINPAAIDAPAKPAA